MDGMDEMGWDGMDAMGVMDGMWCLLGLFFDTRTAILMATCSVLASSLLREVIRNVWVFVPQWHRLSRRSRGGALLRSSTPPQG